FPRTYDEMRPPDAPAASTAVAFDPHSLLIASAAYGGIVALVTFIATPGIMLRSLLRAAGTAAADARPVTLALFAALLALVVDCSINSLTLYFPLFLQVV